MLLFRQFFSTVPRRNKGGLYRFYLDPPLIEEDEWTPKRTKHFPESLYGLYAGQLPIKTYRITEFGKKVPFHCIPKAYAVSLYSELLQQCFPFKATARALDAIDRAGGLDRYLLGSTCDEIASYPGLKLRKKLRLLLESK